MAKMRKKNHFKEKNFVWLEIKQAIWNNCLNKFIFKNKILYVVFSCALLLYEKRKKISVCILNVSGSLILNLKSLVLLRFEGAFVWQKIVLGCFCRSVV